MPNGKLDILGVQSKQTALAVTRYVREEWYSGSVIPFISIKKRNLDIGLEDGLVSPSVVADFQVGEPMVYSVPNLDLVEALGFSMKLEIEPRERVKHKILSVVHPNPAQRMARIEPTVHLAPIMSYIRQEAVSRYEYDVDMTRTSKPPKAIYFSQTSIKSKEDS